MIKFDYIKRKKSSIWKSDDIKILNSLIQEKGIDNPRGIHSLDETELASETTGPCPKQESKAHVH